MSSYSQRSFAGGELSDTLHGRADLPVYALGAKRMENFYVGRDGSAKNRPGTLYVATCKDSHDGLRIERFRFSDDQAYAIEIGTKYFRLFTGGGPVGITSTAWMDATDYVVGDTIYHGATDSYYYCVADHLSAAASNTPGSTAADNYFWYLIGVGLNPSPALEIPTPYAQTDIAALSFSQSGDIITITHPNHMPHELVRRSATWWTMKPPSYKPSMAAPVAIGVAGGSAGDFTIRYAVTAVQKDTFVESLPGRGAAASVSGVTIPSEYAEDAGENIVLESGSAFTTTTGSMIVITAVSAAQPTQADQFIVDAFKDTIWQVGELDAVSTPKTAEILGSAGMRPYPVLTAGGTGDAPDMICLTYRADVELSSKDIPIESSAASWITVDWTAPMDADGNTLTPLEYNVYRSVGDSRFFYLGSTESTSFVDDGKREEDEGLSPPIYRYPFAEGYRPRTSSFYQQRQVFDGGNAKPRQLRLSVAGDFKSYATRSPIQDDDSIDFTLAAREAFTISRFSPLDDLIILTEGAIFSLRGADGTVTPSNLQNLAISYYGAKGIDPVELGDRLLYVQARGSQVRELRFDVGAGGAAGYVGRDMTAFVPRLFDGYTIVDWAYAETPDSIVWAVRSDGTLLALTHVAENNIFAWHRHTTAADGEFLSVTTIPEDGRDVPYFIVKRTVNGADAYYVERLADRHADSVASDRRDDVFVDSALCYDGTNTSESLSVNLTLGSGTGWEAGDTGLTLTAVSGIFGSGDVGNGVRLVGSDGAEGEIVITAVTTPNTVFAVSVRKAIPASVQGETLTTWVAMVDEFSGLDHLEGETVTIYSDGVVLASEVVSGGAVTADDIGGIVCIGLPITARIDTMPIDYANTGARAIADVKKTNMSVSLVLTETRGLTVGHDTTTQEPLRYDEFEAVRDTTTTEAFTGRLRARFGGRPRREGTMTIMQTQPLPANIGAMFIDFNAGERD